MQSHLDPVANRSRRTWSAAGAYHGIEHVVSSYSRTEGGFRASLLGRAITIRRTCSKARAIWRIILANLINGYESYDPAGAAERAGMICELTRSDCHSTLLE